MGFFRDLAKAGSVGFVEDAVGHVGLFFAARKAGVQRFTIDARASNRFFFVRSPSGPWLAGEQLAMSGTLEEAHNWSVGSADM